MRYVMRASVIAGLLGIGVLGGNPARAQVGYNFGGYPGGGITGGYQAGGYPGGYVWVPGYWAAPAPRAPLGGYLGDPYGGAYPGPYGGYPRVLDGYPGVYGRHPGYLRGYRRDRDDDDDRGHYGRGYRGFRRDRDDDDD